LPHVLPFSRAIELFCKISCHVQVKQNAM
jgi:hypothetical protein